MLIRRGFTLAEVLIALTLAAIVVGTAGRSVLHQQRASRHVTAAASTDSRLRMASELVRSHLAFAVPSAGDLSAHANDSSLQLRIPVALGVVCASRAGVATLSVADDDSQPTGATLSPPAAGDSIWWYPGEGNPWIGRPVAHAASGDLACPPLRVMGAALRVRLSSSDTLPLGMPARITRQLRYDFYRGGDGSWQLGRRDWSDVVHRFAAPQPVAGPFLKRTPAGDRTGFRFFDANGDELQSTDPAFVPKIARVRVTLLAEEQGAAPLATGVRREVLDVAVRGRGAH